MSSLPYFPHNSVYEPEAVAPVRLVQPWLDHFQRVIGLIFRLQRHSEDKTIVPGVIRKLAFALCVRISRNHSRSFAGRSGAQRGPTGLHQHPRVAKYKCVYDVQLLVIWRILLLAVVLLLSLALRVGLLQRFTSPCLSCF